MIHDRLRRARVLKGLRHDELARSAGDISKQALSKFERGEAVPSSTRLLQFSRLLGLKPEYFFRSDSLELAPLELMPGTTSTAHARPHSTTSTS